MTTRINITARILGTGAIFLTLAWAATPFLSENWKSHWKLIGIAAYVGGCVVCGIWECLPRILRRFQQVALIEGSSAVRGNFEALVSGATHVTYLGALDAQKLESFKAFWERAQNNKPMKRDVAVDIYNTDPSVYTNPACKHLVEKLIELDRENDLFNFRHYFFVQASDFLFTQDRTGKTHSLTIFGNQGPFGRALRANGSPVAMPPIIKELAPPINRWAQADNVVVVSDTIRTYLRPLEKGWFEPVFPPIDDEMVRIHWRDAILRWFNHTSLQICNSVGEHLKVKITWRLVKESEKDAECFKGWLDVLKSDERVSVDRYLLVNFDLFRRDAEYRRVVESVRTKYLPAPPRQGYTVWFIDTSGLSDKLNSDFALLQTEDADFAQDCDREFGALTGVLRIYFSHNYQTVRDMQTRFRLLDQRPKHNTLTP